MDPDGLSDQPSVSCARRARVLLSSAGDFHVIKIVAISDPSPPRLAESLAKDIGREILRLIDQMKDPSAREGLDQVYHCGIADLCAPCDPRWVEDPFGA